MTPFAIDIPRSDVDDLRTRIARTRWPDDATAEVDDWGWGTPSSVLRPLMDHWTEGYSWTATQERWNALDQRIVEVDGQRIHVVRGGTPGATPLMLVHGWPDGFWRFMKAMPFLADRFDIVVPSIPGFGFSDRLRNGPTGPARVGDLFAGVMDQLGHTRFGVHGGDLGSTIAEVIAQRHPDRVIGLHLGDVPAWHRYTLDPWEASDDERAFLAGMTSWFVDEGAYAALQRTKPQTLGYGLTDSPVALAAWFLEKFRAWSDGDGDVWRRFTPDEILDDVSLYWFTRTSASSARYYRESALTPPDPALRATTPAGFTLFPHDIAVPPRAYADRFFDVRRFTLAPRGGHFGPWEEPAFFAEDVRAFFDGVEA
ncbi:epoxide hydrolase family protein [Microbacterium sp. P03]|uniref:epoxide hydrolase family protein n=1 Tax=Microbacterium sp. P03 TaxID=3366946 RepID=UPI003746A20D